MPFKDLAKQKAAQRAWYERQNKAKRVEHNRQERRKRRAIVDAHKLKNGCSRCGYAVHPAAIDAHHVDEKNFGICAAIQACMAIDRILEELALCELVCANCHRIEHATSRDA